ncbi:MAG: hypothetical protein EHM41_18675 [Chloroflexi bacterium]|nr:MAG: hypothetical protein EHM41_18675 [Chloroflexota bacterium]
MAYFETNLNAIIADWGVVWAFGLDLVVDYSGQRYSALHHAISLESSLLAQITRFAAPERVGLGIRVRLASNRGDPPLHLDDQVIVDSFRTLSLILYS